MVKSGLRKIIHIDCDCFYASVEALDNPTLAGRPFAVGGAAERRGVISTCNYEARAFGVRSAMATAHAKRLCPQLLVLPGRMARYREISSQIHQILRQYSDTIEPLSLDEAYLDVSAQTLFGGSATLMAQAIREQVKTQIGITVSAGVAPNKFLAKIASDWNKPDGLFVIPPAQVSSFVAQLPIEKLHGVGKVTQAKLHQLGIRTCTDLQNLPKEELVQRLGRFGEHLYRLCRGIDDRPIQPRESRKSVSVEHTYPKDLPNLDACLQVLPDLEQRLHKRLEPVKQKQEIKKVFVKIKFHDFTQTTIERCCPRPEHHLYETLCGEAYQRGHRPVRLLGVGVRFEDKHAGSCHPMQQLTLNL